MNAEIPRPQEKHCYYEFECFAGFWQMFSLVFDVVPLHLVSDIWPECIVAGHFCQSANWSVLAWGPCTNLAWLVQWLQPELSFFFCQPTALSKKTNSVYAALDFYQQWHKAEM